MKNTVTNNPSGELRGDSFHRFFHLDLVDLDPEKLVFEVVVAGKLVSILHVFALWDFSEYACFPTSERLESPTQFAVL